MLCAWVLGAAAHVCEPGDNKMWRLQVITVTSRYMVFNNSGEALEYGQRGTTLVCRLQPGFRFPFHWHSIAAPFQLCVRPAEGDWHWSGAFAVRAADACPFHSPLMACLGSPASCCCTASLAQGLCELLLMPAWQ